MPGVVVVKSEVVLGRVEDHPDGEEGGRQDGERDDEHALGLVAEKKKSLAGQLRAVAEDHSQSICLDQNAADVQDWPGKDQQDPANAEDSRRLEKEKHQTEKAKCVEDQHAHAEHKVGRLHDEGITVLEEQSGG